MPLVASSHVDGAFDITITHEPTAGEAQSKLWFADGAWWATLIDPATQELHIARLDPATQGWMDTGALVDDRPHVRADVLWDGTHLTIVTAGDRPTASQAVRISQFHYDPKPGRFVIEPDLPITLSTVGVGDPVLARDSKGTLWLAYVDQARLILRHSLGDVWHWSPAAPPPLASAAGDTRAAALTADGSRVTLVWNDVNDAALKVGQHVDGADPGSWVADTTTVAGLANAPGGFSIRSIATTGGSRLFVAFEIAPDRSSKANPLAPGAIVMIRDPDGGWSNVQLARVKDHFAAPVLAVDDHLGILVAVGFVTNTGTIAYKQSPLDRVGFDSGQGTDLIASSADPNLRNPTSTKQAVDLTSGLLVLAADDGTGHFASGRLATTTATPPGGSAPPGSSSPPPTPPAASILLHDTFAPWAIGTRLPPEWVASGQGRGGGLVVVVAGPGKAGRSLLVRTTSVLGSVRACTSFAPTGAGTVTISALFQIGSVGPSDTTVGSVRGPGGETASVRVTRHRLLAYYDGVRKVTTTRAVAAGVWYRSTIVIRPDTHTFDWTLSSAAGKAIFRIARVHWRQPAVLALDTFCTQAAQGRGSSILLDDLEVLR